MACLDCNVILLRPSSFVAMGYSSVTWRTVVRRNVRSVTVGRANAAYIAITEGMIPYRKQQREIAMTNTILNELTIGELDAVNGGSGLLTGSGPGPLEIINQIRQAIESTLNPTSPPTQDPLAKVFQQAMNGMAG